MFSVAQVGLMAWQTMVINEQRVEAARNTTAIHLGAFHQRSLESPEQDFYRSLLVTQLSSFVFALALLLSSVALIFGVLSDRRWMAHLWSLPLHSFTCLTSSPLLLRAVVMAINVLLSLLYSTVWWMGGVRDYWVPLITYQIIAAATNVRSCSWLTLGPS